MGNENSNERARDFFMGVGGNIERAGNSLLNAATAPSRLMDAFGKFLSGPSSLLLPVIAIGGLYVVMQFKK